MSWQRTDDNGSIYQKMIAGTEVCLNRKKRMSLEAAIQLGLEWRPYASDGIIQAAVVMAEHLKKARKPAKPGRKEKRRRAKTLFEIFKEEKGGD